MSIENDKVVSIHYTLKDTDGNVIESSIDKDPMSYLHGHGNIIPGLENALTGKTEGDELSVTVEPSEGYGEYDESRVQRIPVKRLGVESRKLKPGMMLQLKTQRGPQMARIKKVGRFVVDLDVNHPMAGRTLVFEVTVQSVRDATKEELSHGHAHGPGGHQH